MKSTWQPRCLIPSIRLCLRAVTLALTLSNVMIRAQLSIPCHPQPVNLGTYVMWVHQTLQCNEFLVSKNGRYVVIMTANGYLQVQHPDGSGLWSHFVGTNGMLELQVDSSVLSSGDYFQSSSQIPGSRFGFYDCFHHVMWIQIDGRMNVASVCHGDNCASSRFYIDCFNVATPAANALATAHPYTEDTTKRAWCMFRSPDDSLTFVDDTLRWFYKGKCYVRPVLPWTDVYGVDYDTAVSHCKTGVNNKHVQFNELFAFTSNVDLTTNWDANGVYEHVLTKVVWSSHWTSAHNDKRDRLWTTARRYHRMFVGEDPALGWYWPNGEEINETVFESTDTAKPLNACAFLNIHNDCIKLCTVNKQCRYLTHIQSTGTCRFHQINEEQCLGLRLNVDATVFNLVY